MPTFVSDIFHATGLSESSLFLDLGSVGNVVLQAILETGCRSFGLEVMPDLAYRQGPTANRCLQRMLVWRVLEAIAPMRRGRPPQGQVGKPPSRTASPEKPVAFDTKFGDEDDRAWKGLRAARSGLPSLGADSASLASKGDTDAWSIGSRQSAQKPELSERRAFDNDFSSSFGSKFPSRSPPTRCVRPVQDCVGIVVAVPISAFNSSSTYTATAVRAE